MSTNRFPLSLLEGRFSVVRLDAADAMPAWALDRGRAFAAVVRTEDELSVVCREEDVPATAGRVEPGFRALKLLGPVPFTTVGVVSGMTKPLAEAGIGVFLVSTYDTDYLLVKEAHLQRAVGILQRAGFATV